jgi:hypothetical protein
MPFPVIIAHGALGYWDEVIFISVVIVFLVMMANSWLRSRDELPEDTPAAPPPPRASDTHFELE